MKIKFPGKSDTEAEQILEKVCETTADWICGVRLQGILYVVDDHKNAYDLKQDLKWPNIFSVMLVQWLCYDFILTYHCDILTVTW